MKVIKFYSFMALALAGSFLFAQEQPDTLTLAQVREYALQNNRTLLNSKDQVTASKAKFWETVTNGLPQVEAGFDYTTYFNKDIKIDFGGVPMSVPMSDASSGKIQASQLIFSGQYIAGVQLAKIANKLSEQNLIMNEIDIKENVTNSYYAILTNEKTLKIISENLINLDGILKHTNNMYSAGIMEATDVDQIRISVSQLLNMQKSLERLQQLSFNMLKFQLGISPETEIVLRDSLEYLITFIDLQLDSISSFDITGNINYQLMESQELLAQKQVDMQFWSFTPTIAGFYSYTRKFKVSGFDFAPNHVAGLSVSVPLLTSGTRMLKVAQAKKELNIAQRNKEMVRDQLALQEKQQLFDFQSALENYSTQKENVEIANRVYTSMQNKYKQGMASSLDLTQANSNYLTAENNYLSAVLTLLQANTSLEKLYNTL